VKIVVMGTGGVGGYFGAKLARSGEAVTFVARGEHLRALRASGLRVTSATEGEFVVKSPATGDLSGDGPADMVLFCVKSYDTDSAARAIKPVVGSETVVLSLQNGVDNEEKIESVVGEGHVLGGAAYIFATIESPGVITHSSGGRIAFGELDGRESGRARGILAAFHRAGISAALSTNIRRVLWEKYLLITALSGMTALTRCPVGIIRSLPETRRMYRCLLEEVATLAKAVGIDLAPDAVDTALAFTDKLAPGEFSSLHYDLAHGKRLELEALQGYAVRLGERLGVPTPTLAAVYAALTPYLDGPPI
jgi:2-dehydropantoate 2-reductase